MWKLLDKLLHETYLISLDTLPLCFLSISSPLVWSMLPGPMLTAAVSPLCPENSCPNRKYRVEQKIFSSSAIKIFAWYLDCAGGRRRRGPAACYCSHTHCVLWYEAPTGVSASRNTAVKSTIHRHPGGNFMVRNQEGPFSGASDTYSQGNHLFEFQSNYKL